ncbi:transporter substrate-binding domain-containing protein [Azotosporobacter soli]|uniref:transporter substrate-binding domain-containing protein n=1 Tax=Azotosporobacter soli TaxID=3055040 RepID=UPI0031FEFBDC
MMEIRRRIVLGALLITAMLGAFFFYESFCQPETAWQPTELNLTEDERQWLEAHKVIRLGLDEQYLPLEAYDEKGRFIGISAEYATILERQLHVKIETTRGLNWSQVLTAAKEGKVDLICSMAQSPEREKYMLFSEVYLRYPVVVVTRDTLKDLESVEGLRGKTVAGVKDYWIYDLSRLVYSFLTWRYYQTESDCLRAVSVGDADAYITDAATANYQIEQLQLSNLRIAMETPYFWEGRMAVRKDWPELAGIVNKALAAIPQSERNRINDKWLMTKKKSLWQNREFRIVAALATGLALTVFAFGFVWNRSLRRQVAEKTEDLRLANDSLEEQVTKRTQALTTANRELTKSNEKLANALEQLQQTQSQLVQSEKMASLNTIVAGVAHEINTPLGSSVTMASFLAQQAKELEETFAQSKLTRGELQEFLSGQREAAALLLANLQRAAEMVQSFKRVSADQASEVRRVFPVRQCLADVVASLRGALKNRQLKIIVECPEDWCVDSYPGALSQVAANLILNSLSHAYNPDDAGQITLSARQAENRFIFTYSDDGKGIEAEILPHIFDPFYTTNRSGGNTGLGLYVLYQLAQQTFGGELLCSSEAGKGTVFTLQFPLLP